MYCHHCGAKLPDNAKFCPECGGRTVLNIDEEKQEKLVLQSSTVLQQESREEQEEEPKELDKGSCMITRKRSKLSGVTTKIFIDDVMFCRIREGQSTVQILDEGPHILKVETPGSGMVEEEFYVYPNEMTLIRFELNVFSRGGHKILYCGTAKDDPDSAENKIKRKTQAQLSTPPQPRNICPKCNGMMIMQTVSESRRAGCGTILLYIILCLTILGILIVIPLALRKKTETVTYAVCQNCGYKERRNGGA